MLLIPLPLPAEAFRMQTKLPRFSPPGASQKTMPEIPLLFI
ncbi:hypothetical protein GCWU000341_00913 [Oribacterium sp. oral taxon 078 str. F0262]|nr:hypothetical protein GCWU000341_00913 [Oribacterium sp. oral taxon 078 str. F0262]